MRSNVVNIANTQTRSPGWFSFLLLLLSLILPAAPSSAAPATSPAEQAAPASPVPSTQPATKPTIKSAAPSEQDRRRRVARLTRKSLQLLEQKNLDEAEKVLREAIDLDPNEDTNLYNLACVRALKGDREQAMQYLRRSVEAGFTDFYHIEQDSDLKALHDYDPFKRLLAQKDVYQRKAADRAVAELKKQFGAGYLYEVDVADKLVFATNVDQQTLDGLKHRLKAQAHSQWAQIFDHKPDVFVTVVVPSLSDYKKIIKMQGVEGIYIDAMKTLIADHLGQVMTHEFTHALHAADRAPLDQEHPIWLAEGLASMYEAATFEGKNGDQLVPHDNFRLQFLQNAGRGRNNRLIPLERLLKMKQQEFVQHATLAYGQSSSLLLYLYEKGLLKKFYETYKAGYEKDPTGQQALEEATGEKLADLEKSWTKWMLHRPAPSFTTGPDGAFVGAELNNDEIDGIKLSTILTGGPADKAGLKPNDVLIGIDGNEVRDRQTFGPVIATHKPGDQVVLKVRRDGKYLDIPLTLGKRSAVLAEVANGKPKEAKDQKDSKAPTTRPTSPTSRPESGRT